MRVLVTGANGFIGRAVVVALLARGHQVRALIRPAASLDGLWGDEVEVVRADLRSPPPLSKAFEGVEVLVHLAADVNGSEEDQFATTVVGTEHLLAAMAGTTARRVVLASSVAVYDWAGAKGILDETTPLASNLDERGAYAIAKVWQERVARRMAAAQGFELVVLRPGFVWGREHALISGMGQSVGGLHFVVTGTRLPLSYVENCADAFVAAVERPAAAGHTVNVVDTEGLPAWRYMGVYLNHTGISGPRVPVPYRLGLQLARVAMWTAIQLFGPNARLPSVLVPARFEARFKPLRFSMVRLREVLDWRPPFSFEEAVERTYDAPRMSGAPKAQRTPQR